MSPDEREIAWHEWLAGRPEHVRVIAEHFPPWEPVRIKSTGQKGHIYSFGERKDGSVCLQVTVRAEENPGSLHSELLPEGHRVFGLAPDDVELWGVATGEAPEK
jgi:hypothetical protein